MYNAYIVEAVRTPMGRYKYGTLNSVRPDELGATAVRGLLGRVPQLNRNDIGDVILGCAFPELHQGWNAARTIAIRAGIPNNVPAITINRWCSSGLQSISYANDQIKLGYSDVVVAGGFESMSFIPLGGRLACPNPVLMETYPEYYLSMGLTAEKVASIYNITRKMQDDFAYRSFINAEKAITSGRFKDEIVPVEVAENGKTKIVEIDDIIFGITYEKITSARPVFKVNGTVTAPNSSKMTDAASAVLLMSERKMIELGLKPLAKLIAFAAVGVDPDIMGIGPIYAIPKALKMANMSINDIDLFEINEAFASQAVACVNELKINPEIVNVNGGGCALGHPTGCTGARLTTTLLNELKKRELKYGIVSMCVGAGQGAAGIFELM